MKKTGKILALLLVSLFLISIAVTVVSALTSSELATGTGTFMDSVKAFLVPITTTLFGDSGADGELIGKVLIFILIVAVISAVLSVIPLFQGKAGISFLVSVIIAFLGVRFLPGDMISSLATPSSALAASITIILPFIIFGWFVVKTITSSTLRRFAWIVFAGVFVVLWLRNPNTAWNWMYLAILLGCLLAIVLDGTIHRFFQKAAIDTKLNYVQKQQLRRLENEIEEEEKALGKRLGAGERTEINESIKQKKQAIADIIKQAGL